MVAGFFPHHGDDGHHQKTDNAGDKTFHVSSDNTSLSVLHDIITLRDECDVMSRLVEPFDVNGLTRTTFQDMVKKLNVIIDKASPCNNAKGVPQIILTCDEETRLVATLQSSGNVVKFTDEEKEDGQWHEKFACLHDVDHLEQALTMTRQCKDAWV